MSRSPLYNSFSSTVPLPSKSTASKAVLHAFLNALVRHNQLGLGFRNRESSVDVGFDDAARLVMGVVVESDAIRFLVNGDVYSTGFTVDIGSGNGATGAGGCSAESSITPGGPEGCVFFRPRWNSPNPNTPPLRLLRSEETLLDALLTFVDIVLVLLNTCSGATPRVRTRVTSWCARGAVEGARVPSHGEGAHVLTMILSKVALPWYWRGIAQ
jgi:hypothetical protein